MEKIKSKLLGANEIHRTLVRLAHEIIEKNTDLTLLNAQNNNIDNIIALSYTKNLLVVEYYRTILVYLVDNLEKTNAVLLAW